MQNELDQVYDYITQNNLNDKLLNLKIDNFKPINKVNLAFLNMIETRRNLKDFLFQYNRDKFYYTFITIESNPNFGQEFPNQNSNLFLGNIFTKQQSPYFNFDYNKNLIFLNICHKETLDSEISLHSRINLNRESTLISHTTRDNIEYYRETKNVMTTENSSMDIDAFMNFSENYFVIEVESRKPEWEISIKEDGVTNVIYFLTNCKELLIEYYTTIKYAIFYIKPNLENYISKYIYDLIYDFTHLPNPHLLKFLENFGIILTKNDTQKIIFPLKQKVKSLRNLSYENKIDYMNKQIPNIKKTKSINSVPYYKFIRLINKYDYYYFEKELKIKLSHLKKKRKYSYLNSSCQVDELNDKISKERKINLNKTLTDFMTKINENLKMHTNIQNSEILDKFLLTCLNKYLLQSISYKGFINIDIVLNEDSMVDLQCYKRKKLNNSCNEFCFKLLSKCLNICNLFFDFNEGFFHKHFNVLDFSYNFNEKNIIHTFPSCFDSSKKNKIRIFDVPFMEKWNNLIGSLILHIWKDQNGLGIFNENNFENNYNENFKKESFKKFRIFFIKCVEIIISEVFELYEEAFPDFLLFCNRISKFPLNKYNCIDNLCQHFTNASIQTLLKNNTIFFHPFDLVYNIDRSSLQSEGIMSQPNLNVIIEPYLIYIDTELYNYIEVKEKKEMYLDTREMTLEKYLKEVKEINSDKINYNLILGNKNESIDVKDEDLTLLESQTVFSHVDKQSYDFSFLLNLSYFFIYKLMMEIKEKIVDYYILKRYINSIDTSISLSFDGSEKTVIQNTEKNKNAVKQQCKKAKAILLKNLDLMYKVKSYNENMLLVFHNYLKSVVLKIKSQNNIKDDIKNTFIKVGYFLVNIKTVKEESQVDEFVNSEFYYNYINY